MGLDEERSVKDGLLKGLLRGLDRWHSELDYIGKDIITLKQNPFSVRAREGILYI
ncbi:MAG: hypothetical protein K940chlam2_01472 [Chlamydiae bacterium]|nr:hypothetical protein [Chlamydiota bacterium]